MAGFSLKDGMIGESEEMHKLYKSISLVAPTDVPVFIMGERGTGKELAAKAIHNNSPRKEKPYVILDCAAIHPTLLESELFGHKKGAFTNAYFDRKGKMETAHLGTLFLDEIGDMDVYIQPKLLRVLEEKKFQMVGENETRKVDVRVIAATSKDMDRLISTEKFRQELYDRIKTYRLYIPPLRKRKEDIPLLVKYFKDQFAKRNKLEIADVNKEAMDWLVSYDWPGNVRELKSTIERLAIDSEGKEITPNLINQDYELRKLGSYHSDFIQKICSFTPNFLEKIAVDAKRTLYHAVNRGMAREISYTSVNETKKITPEDAIRLYIKKGMPEQASKLRQFHLEKWDRVPLAEFCDISGLHRYGFYKNEELVTEDIAGIRFGLLKDLASYLESSGNGQYRGFAADIRRYLQSGVVIPDLEIVEPVQHTIKVNHPKKEKSVAEHAKKSEPEKIKTDYNGFVYIHEIAKLSGIPRKTLYRAIQLEKRKDPDKRAIKYSEEEDESRIRKKPMATIPSFIEYFRKTGSIKYIFKLEKIMESGSMSDSLGHYTAADNSQKEVTFRENPKENPAPQTEIAEYKEPIERKPKYFTKEKYRTPEQREFKKETEEILGKLYADDTPKDLSKYSGFAENIDILPLSAIEKIARDNSGSLHNAIKKGEIAHRNVNGTKSVKIQNAIKFYSGQGLENKASTLKEFSQSITGKVPLKEVFNLFEVPKNSYSNIQHNLKVEYIEGVKFMQLESLATYFESMKLGIHREKYAPHAKEIRKYLETGLR